MKQILFTVLTFLTLHLHAADYYWVGGSGNWNDLNHWHLGSSAGPNPSIVPSLADNVFFGSYSGFTAVSKTVTLNTNGFCNNMTWEAGVTNSPAFNSSATLTLTVGGNLTLASTVTHSLLYINLTGSNPATITTNGNIQGTLNVSINKPASGLTIADSLVYTAPGNSRNSVTLFAGYFNAPGKNINMYAFGSNNSLSRSVDISNATVQTSAWNYQGTNKSLNANASILKTANISVDSGYYPQAEVAGTVDNNINISNTTFDKLTFTSTSLTSQARILSNNTVDSLIFMGSGSIRLSNNTVQYVSAEGPASIGGGSNVVHYANMKNSLQIIELGNNIFDTLLTAPNKSILITGTNTITQYFRAGGLPCDGFTEVTGAAGGGTLNFGSSASASIDNVLLTGLTATGSIAPITVNGIDNGGNTGFVINQPSLVGTTLYWIGGSGDWNDKAHWSTSSGGPGGACIPFIADDVVFNANSGLTTGSNVTTSGNSYCKNMTWASGITGTPSFTTNNSFKLRVYGSIVLSPAVTMQSQLELTGTDSVTVTTNNSAAGNLVLTMIKTGTGSVTFTDNWSNPLGGDINLTSGRLKLQGRTLSIHWITSATGGTVPRFVDITDATINLSYRWDYRGTNKTIASTGSYIKTEYILSTDELNYPWVDCTYGGGINAFSAIDNTTFGLLTFTDTSVTSPARIGSNNTVRRIEFKGQGNLVGGGNSIDTLLLAGSRKYSFVGTNTITKYLLAQATPCAGLTEMRGNPASTLAFNAGAVASVANIYMQNMTATGPITPIAFNGADAGGNSGWTINVAAGSPRYWIGGSGDWNDNTHWSATSGGAGGACIPTVYDDVYFNAGSGFTAVSKTVTINNGNAYCHNVNWTGAANSPIWSKSGTWGLESWGDSIVVIAAATFNVAPLILKGSNMTYLKGDAPTGNFSLNIDKINGGLTLLNDYNNTNTDFSLLNGAFNVPGRMLNVNSVTNNNLANASSMDISNATINAAGWRYSNIATNHILNAANSTINTGTFAVTGLTYNKVNISGTAGAHAQLAGTTIDSLVFTNTSTSSVVGINGANNNLNYVEYKGSGNVYSTGNTINTLVFFPGKIYTFTAGTTTNITNLWFASGTPCSLTEIVSSSTTANATINKTGGAPEFDYVRVRRITAAGSIPFVAFNHTIDQGNNTNWNIAPYNGVAPIYGLGPDTALLASAFPYVLHTDGFFGNPSSQYLWNTGSTADSLVVTDTGIYSVNVNFVDGCNINDNIHITLAVPLPVTLTSFTAAVQSCQANLNWKVSNAVNFSYFLIEKSKDGRSFSDIGAVSYAKNVAEYNYADKNIGEGTFYYRLKLADLDGKYQYSPIESIYAACGNKQIKVYPTLTKGEVYIDLPAGYEQAQIEVYNTFGQLLNVPDKDKVSQSQMHRVQLHGMAQGQYLLKVIKDNEVNTFKVIYQP